MSKKYNDSDLEKLKKLELMILKEVITICDNHEIDYYIYAGTALGAVRHGGFIPWDDDIDIIVFRKDYEKLLDILEEELSSNFYVLSLEKQEDFFLPFAKVCLKNTRFGEFWTDQVSYDLGIFIDIFPLDNVPGNKFRRLFFYYKCHILDHIVINSILHITTESKIMNIVHNSLFVFLNNIPISRGYWKKLFHKSLTKYENTNTEYVTCYSSQAVALLFGKNGFYSKSEFAPPQKIKFEDLTVSAPRDLDSVLKKCYGNYMELPPKDKRVNHSPDVIDFGEY